MSNKENIKYYVLFGVLRTATELRKGYRTITGLDNDNEMTDDEIYEYLLNACKDK